jgi:hypothetical protein
MLRIGFRFHAKIEGRSTDRLKDMTFRKFIPYGILAIAIGATLGCTVGPAFRSGILLNERLFNFQHQFLT